MYLRKMVLYSSFDFRKCMFAPLVRMLFLCRMVKQSKKQTNVYNIDFDLPKLYVSVCRPSPKLVLIILQLCRVALPLMDATECGQVELPSWGTALAASHWNTSRPISDPPARIVSLLLARLGDFLVPGQCTHTQCKPQWKMALKMECWNNYI